MYLLDLNVLISLTWPNHAHHGVAGRWYGENKGSGWATCGLTQAGFIRISSNPSIVDEAVSPGEALGILRALTADENHTYIHELPLTDMEIPGEFLLGHRQVTDCYLTGLAFSNQLKLATFDRALAQIASNTVWEETVLLIE